MAVLAFAVFEPVQVLPRIRLAPGFALTGQGGSTVTSDQGRGSVTLFTFAPIDCGTVCEELNATMREVGQRVEDTVDLGGADFRMMTVSLDADEPSRLAEAATAAGADGSSWIWVGGPEEDIRDVVGGGFRVFFEREVSTTDFDPVFVIVDGAGLIRGEYRYATLASDVDRLTRHISLLGDELRHSRGVSSLVYEAAHILTCYP